MLNDQEVVMLWRRLFRGQKITSETVTRAHGLLDELGSESPLKLRLTTELREILAVNNKKVSEQ